MDVHKHHLAEQESLYLSHKPTSEPAENRKGGGAGEGRDEEWRDEVGMEKKHMVGVSQKKAD